jgi:hypothetical protein
MFDDGLMVLGSTAGAIPVDENYEIDDRSARRAALDRVADRTRPVTLAREQRLPVLDPLAPLLPEGGLRRGAVIGVEGIGATSLLLSLLAGPSAAGSWVALVGLPQVGLAAAAELGVVLDRVAVVADPPASRWAATVAALIDAFDVVALTPGAVRPQQARRLAARARERGAVLALVRGRHRWGEGPDVRLVVVGHEWRGLERGHGHLRARRLTVVATGRRDAARPRQASLWLTDADGRITPALDADDCVAATHQGNRTPARPRALSSVPMTRPGTGERSAASN